MLGYVVAHSIYPKGYNCDPKIPLPFINIASQKNFIGFYHLGIYAFEDLLSWFKACSGNKLFRLNRDVLIIYKAVKRSNSGALASFANAVNNQNSLLN